MKRLSLQWRITLMSVLLIGTHLRGHEFAAVLLRRVTIWTPLRSSPLQGGGTAILNDGGAGEL